MPDSEEIIVNTLEENTESYIEFDDLKVPKRLPVLPLRDVVIFPYMIFPVLVGRESSLKAANAAVDKDKFIFLSAQKNSSIDEPTKDDIYEDGTVAKIIQILKLPNGLMKILVDGLFQAKIKRFFDNSEYLEVEIENNHIIDNMDQEFDAIIRHASTLFTEYVKNNRNIPAETLIAYENITEPHKKFYYIAANLVVNVDVKQNLLSLNSLKQQFYELITILANEIDILKIEREIDTKVQNSIQKTQKKFFIQEQIRILQNELGEDEETNPEFVKLREDIIKAKMPKEVEDKAFEELNKLKKTPPMSPESTVIRNYLDWLISLPWISRTKDNLDINHVKKILDEDHHGLEKPKDRILEHIAVLNLVKEMRGQILCFVGPPGVGKTSLGKSIARALGRKFVRISLGGVRDEAEIRGHRRTYIGSMPGKIIQSMKKAGVVNPVLLLDEIDKMSMDFRGDPSSALLEVLDPEQNHTFNDHYLDCDYDLSHVLFITTANVRYQIPLPLQDRMEIIELPGYLETDKIEIAKKHIIPKQIKEHGLEKINLTFTDEAIVKVITQYTKEAGVRNLEREIAKILRKTAKEIVLSKTKNKNKFVIDENKIESYLGVPRYKNRYAEEKQRVGSVLGLAWTSVGGELLPVDCTIMAGNEKLILTGQMGDVMKESALAALSYLRSNSKKLGIKEDFYHKKEIHIHLPEGAIPKDGPSAGITMAMAIYSAATGKSPNSGVAMTGEITLRGRILAIGGLTEKLLAAKRSGVKTVLIPKENEKDLFEIPEAVKEGLKIIPIETIAEAIPYVFAIKKERSAKSRKKNK
ncbi:MAG TPA: endopeptidase La [Bacteroidota bacterium]|jgi:ATP-dependent Lon protease|nr:endopeptidase La [Bacteroidota bacterium]